MSKNRTKSENPMILVYLVIGVAIIAGAVMLFPRYRTYQKKQAELHELNSDLYEKKAVNVELNQEVKGLQSSPEAVEKVAREKFNLCRDGEVIYKYENPVKSDGK